MIFLTRIRYTQTIILQSDRYRELLTRRESNIAILSNNVSAHFPYPLKFLSQRGFNSFLIESLSKDVFKRRTSTGSEVFSLNICLDAKKFVLISFFSLIRTIYLRVSTKPPPNDAKRPLKVDVRRSKTLLLKLPIIALLSLRESSDQYRFPGNCPPTPPLSPHFALSEK